GVKFRQAAVETSQPKPPIARHGEHVPDKATEAMHDRGVILLPIAWEPTQPDQQRDRRFPQGSIHLIEQQTEIVGEAILPLRRRRPWRGSLMFREGRDRASRQ